MSHLNRVLRFCVLIYEEEGGHCLFSFESLIYDLGNRNEIFSRLVYLRYLNLNFCYFDLCCFDFDLCCFDWVNLNCLFGFDFGNLNFEVLILDFLKGCYLYFLYLNCCYCYYCYYLNYCYCCCYLCCCFHCCYFLNFYCCCYCLNLDYLCLCLIFLFHFYLFVLELLIE